MSALDHQEDHDEECQDQPNARGEMNYKEAGMWDVLEMMEAMQKRYNIDAERIYLYGHSMGGRGSWYIGLRKPDLFAAVAAFAGRNRSTVSAHVVGKGAYTVSLPFRD